MPFYIDIFAFCLVRRGCSIWKTVVEFGGQNKHIASLLLQSIESTTLWFAGSLSTVKYIGSMGFIIGSTIRIGIMFNPDQRSIPELEDTLSL